MLILYANIVDKYCQLGTLVINKKYFRTHAISHWELDLEMAWTYEMKFMGETCPRAGSNT